MQTLYDRAEPEHTTRLKSRGGSVAVRGGKCTLRSLTARTQRAGGAISHLNCPPALLCLSPRCPSLPAGLTAQAVSAGPEGHSVWVSGHLLQIGVTWPKPSLMRLRVSSHCADAVAPVTWRAAGGKGRQQCPGAWEKGRRLHE